MFGSDSEIGIVVIVGAEIQPGTPSRFSARSDGLLPKGFRPLFGSDRWERAEQRLGVRTIVGNFRDI